ncbi:hypothetical protein BDV28DRAFT_136306 [Aspergillus coremiiformis]|uniref:Uncharacterized protein n=1 Tax=Aspergillus coremiiformis TaxID=138285 RepID=A0A5N6Z349_9EURO|nr:hypothetical protein BDV28DRAFT_136306 [Aspergillus coremiiformis]
MDFVPLPPPKYHGGNLGMTHQRSLLWKDPIGSRFMTGHSLHPTQWVTGKWWPRGPFGSDGTGSHPWILPHWLVFSLLTTSTSHVPLCWMNFLCFLILSHRNNCGETGSCALWLRRFHLQGRNGELRLPFHQGS